MVANKLTHSFFLRPDVIRISRDLLGHYLFTHLQNESVTGGMIVETEAYKGTDDRASHAYGNRRTRRTEVMFRNGGIAYVYLCYGIHSLFNIITNVEDVPDAILIRAIEPTHGIDVMLARRRKKQLDHSLTSGPAVLSEALGIGLQHTGTSVSGNEIWIGKGVRFRPQQIEAGPRVGVHYAGKHAKHPWRFRVRNSVWTSRAK